MSTANFQFNVRRAVIGDVPTLKELRLQALTDSPEAFGSTYERELARTTEAWQRWISHSVTFILELDGEPRGLVAGVPDQQDRSQVHLMAMWVPPDLRGSGAANQLISSVKDWAAEMGAATIRLNVIEGNARARRCYERAGFRVTGNTSVLERNGAIEVEMTFDVVLPGSRP